MTRLEIEEKKAALQKEIEALTLQLTKPDVIKPKMRVWGMTDRFRTDLIWLHFECMNWKECEVSRQNYYEVTGYFPGGLPRFGCQPFLIKEGKIDWQGGWLMCRPDADIAGLLQTPSQNSCLHSEFQSEYNQ